MNLTGKGLKEMDFKNVDNKYRPIPFWSWNEKLTKEETARQIEMMHRAGIGGYFMHARGGLQTEYMGEEWFENVAVGIKEGKKYGMFAWAYDENGWPSGFGNGVVNGRGIQYQQKYLRYEKEITHSENTICTCGGMHFYYDVNPFYIDTLDGEVVKVFINEIYQPYYERFKNEIEGFFTDEPQISRNGIPWSFIMPEEYEKAYGENLLERLPELFEPVGEYERTRFRFWKMVTDLFSKNYMKQIYDWCDARGLKLTGHFVLEETLETQLTTNGAVMPNYEYLHIPGIDWLGRPIFPCLTALQLTSVAHQLGKKQILAEDFALCGHNTGHNELKGIYEWQMVRGVNLLCQHLQGYSMRGIRKRDFPPAMFYQQPWWEEYKVFNDAMSRIGMLLAEGKVEYDTLVIHPQSTAWTCFDNNENKGLEECYQRFLEILNLLDHKHILYHLGDETIIERHGRVEGDTFVIGTQRYKKIILPEDKYLFDSTRRLLCEFERGGGIITTAEEMEENSIINCPEILYTKRAFHDFNAYYFVNHTDNVYETEIAVGNQYLDMISGELKPFDGNYTFQAFDSLFVIDDGEARPGKLEKSRLLPLDLGGKWKIKDSSLNALTLDYCDYYFDDELIEKNGYVLNIQERACKLKRPVNIKCEYTFQVDAVPKTAYLICETPEIYEIFINGNVYGKKEEGYFIDTSFRKLNIAEYLTVGENKIVLSVNFKQSPEIYENIEKSMHFESEKNKLTYDMEIEPIYIAGDFSVRTDGEFTPLERNGIRYGGGFVISEAKKEITLNHIEQQGYPFFAGQISLVKEFDLDDVNYKFAFQKAGINAVRLRVNGGEAKSILWEPFEVDIKDDLRVGKNEIEITLMNNLRNLLGPHHLPEGESYRVIPASFYKEYGVWLRNAARGWNDDYCFVNTGII